MSDKTEKHPAKESPTVNLNDVVETHGVDPHRVEPHGTERRNFTERRILAESMLAETQGPMTGGVILLSYALMLGADTFQIGLISTAMMIGASLQLVAHRLLRSFGTRKRVAGVSLAVLSAVRVGIGLLPFVAMWIASQYLAWGLLGALVIASAAGQVAEIMRLSWISDVVPEDKRGRFLGDRHFFMQLVGSSVAISAAWFIDWQSAVNATRGLHATQSLFIIAGILGLGSILVLRTIPEPPASERIRTRKWSFLAEPIRDKRFRPFMAHSALWHLGGPIAGPFFNLYMIEVLDMPLGMVAAYNFLGQLSSIYSVRFWGHLVDRFGNLPVLRLCVAMKTIFPLMWIAMPPATTPFGHTILYIVTGIVHMWRTFNSGQQISTVNLALILMPENDRTSYLSTFRTLGNWIHAVSPAAAGFLAATMQDSGWSQHWAIILLFVISALVRSGSYAALHWIEEPFATKLNVAWRTMKRVPGFLPTSGVGPWIRFWGGPIFAGFAIARLRLGAAIVSWRGSFTADDT
jgi:MFS family permease